MGHGIAVRSTGIETHTDIALMATMVPRQPVARTGLRDLFQNFPQVAGQSGIRLGGCAYPGLWLLIRLFGISQSRSSARLVFAFGYNRPFRCCRFLGLSRLAVSLDVAVHVVIPRIGTVDELLLLLLLLLLHCRGVGSHCRKHAAVGDCTRHVHSGVGMWVGR